MKILMEVIRNALSLDIENTNPPIKKESPYQTILKLSEASVVNMFHACY